MILFNQITAAGYQIKVITLGNGIGRETAFKFAQVVLNTAKGKYRKTSGNDVNVRDYK